MCLIAGVPRSSYYKWLKRTDSRAEDEDRHILEKIKMIHEEDPAKGYRRIRDDLERDYAIKANDKRILRLCRIGGIKSMIKYRDSGCTVNDKDPQHLAENVLDRDFRAERPNEKWVTDVTEFKYYVHNEKYKLYLSAIMDLYDRRIVAYEIGDSNNNDLVYTNFDNAAETEPDAHPIFHSDRGFQYTNMKFYDKLLDAGMTQSMSRVGKCLDNGPMEGFWGILKRERYYGNRFTDRDELAGMIDKYIRYYNFGRYQRKLGCVTPMEKHESYYLTAA